MPSAPSPLCTTLDRAGRTTSFLDVHEAKNGKKYIAMSESRLDEQARRQRATLRVFGETVDQVRQAVEEAVRAFSA